MSSTEQTDVAGGCFFLFWAAVCFLGELGLGVFIGGVILIAGLSGVNTGEYKHEGGPLYAISWVILFALVVAWVL